jgi:3-oxoacyl-(acyl-carrier-protein) synthase
MTRQIVVTGLGVVHRDAASVPDFLDWLMPGGGLPGVPRHMDTSAFRAGRAYAVDPEGIRRRLAGRLAQSGAAPVSEIEADCAGHGLLAAAEALASAGLGREARAACGCALATTSGGLMDRFQDAVDDGDGTAAGYGDTVLPGAAAAILARSFGLTGPTASFSCACASSSLAIGFALSRIRHGDAPVMLAGGSDRMRAADFAGFNALRAMDRDSCRPFAADRRGMVIGDGAAMLVLEDEDHARARGAQVLGRIVDIGLSLDAHHITHPNPDGLARAMREALDRAGLDPDAIGYVNCHGTGTPVNDKVEAEALAEVFRDPGRRPVISSTKGATGHLLGSAGAIEALITVLVLREGLVPAMATTGDPIDTGFPMPGNAGPRRVAARYAMSNSLGFGGINSSIIFATAD